MGKYEKINNYFDMFGVAKTKDDLYDDFKKLPDEECFFNYQNSFDNYIYENLHQGFISIDYLAELEQIAINDIKSGHILDIQDPTDFKAFKEILIEDLGMGKNTPDNIINDWANDYNNFIQSYRDEFGDNEEDSLEER